MTIKFFPNVKKIHKRSSPDDSDFKGVLLTNPENERHLNTLTSYYDKAIMKTCFIFNVRFTNATSNKQRQCD